MPPSVLLWPFLSRLLRKALHAVEVLDFRRRIGMAKIEALELIDDADPGIPRKHQQIDVVSVQHR